MRILDVDRNLLEQTLPKPTLRPTGHQAKFGRDTRQVAVQTIQQKQLSDQQRARFNALQLAATPYRSPRSF
jgi:hypothetical protein